jgi:hypothetical protein
MDRPAKTGKLIIMLALVTSEHDPAFRVGTILCAPSFDIMRN